MRGLEESSEEPVAEKSHPGSLDKKDYWKQEEFPGKATIGALRLSLAFWAAVGYLLWLLVLR